jgi:hypothetical protein
MAGVSWASEDARYSAERGLVAAIKVLPIGIVLALLSWVYIIAGVPPLGAILLGVCNGSLFIFLAIGGIWTRHHRPFDLLEWLLSGSQLSKPTPVEAQLAKLVKLAEQQTTSIDELQVQSQKLQVLVDDLRAELAEARRQNRRSSLLMFWGGVAFSIPIGVLINLATS